MENMIQVKPKKKNKTKKKVIAILNTLEIFAIVFAFFVIIASISTKGGEINRLPIIDVSFLAIQTESMEPTINVGDLVIVKGYNPNEELQAGFRESETPGDIVAVWAGGGDDRYLRIHRIIEIWEDPNLVDTDNQPLVWCRTHGDNYEVSTGADIPFLTSDIVAVYSGRLPIVGKILDAIQKPTTFLLFIFLPMLAIFVWNLFSFIKFFVDLKRKTELAKATETGELSDELKELAIQEFLKKQKEEKEAKEKEKNKEEPKV